jgi:alkyldihydroxyacetonephosphate synthase
VEWATVGGYIAARGSGVLSTRYGKIEDLVLSLSVATPATGLISTVSVPRHAVGPELTQLFVGSEGTLGVITRATLQLAPLPAERRFAAGAFPSVSAGVAAIRRTLQLGHRPSVVRMYDEDATRLAFAPVVGEDLSGVYTVLAFEGDSEAVEVEERRTLQIAAEAGGELLDPALGQRWWDRRYDFYHPPHQPELPAIWGTLDVVATYARIEAVYEALHKAVREPYADIGLELRMHFSHWYPWGTMIYGRFVVPDGGPDALELHDRIWEDGMTAALDAGGVMNDHHGVGIKLGPYMRRQHGGALDAMRQIKAALDPNNIMNPGKMGL